MRQPGQPELFANCVGLDDLADQYCLADTAAMAIYEDIFGSLPAQEIANALNSCRMLSVFLRDKKEQDTVRCAPWCRHSESAVRSCGSAVMVRRWTLLAR